MLKGYSMLRGTTSPHEGASKRCSGPLGRFLDVVKMTALMPALLLASSAVMAQQADILVNHVDSPDPGPAGGEFVYSMRITNNGPNTAENVQLSNVMPPGSTFVSFSQTGGQVTSCLENIGGKNTCSIGTLPVGIDNSVTYVLRVILPAAGVFTNRVDVTSSTSDPNSANNADNDNTKQSTTATAAADLVMNAEARVAGGSVSTVAAGQEFDYVLSVTNQGPNAVASNGRIRVVFTVPTGVSVRSAPAGAGWSCVPTGSFPRPQGTEFTCERTGSGSELNNGSTTTPITVPAVTNVTAGTGSEIQASFDVSAFQPNTQPMPDGKLANNNSVVSLESTAGSDLAVSKARSTATIAVGENITFTLTPRLNGGLAPSGTITVKDVLDTRLTLASVSGVGWACGAVGQEVTCTRSDGNTFANFTNLPVISIVATANAAGSGIPNTAMIEAVGPGAHPDPVEGNNASSVTFSSDDKADLSLTKGASLNPVLVGQGFNYSLTVRNNGPLGVPSAQSITVTEMVPANVRITGTPTGTGWACVSSSGSFPVDGPATLTCTRATGLANGVTTTITLPAELTAGGTYVNNACVALAPGTRNDGNSANNCEGRGVTASGVAGTGADLRVVSKVASPNSVDTGKDLTYVITVRNDGPDAATNVRVTDALNNLMTAGGVQSITSSQGSCTATTPADGPTVNVQCQLGTVANGAQAVVTIVVRPRIAKTGMRDNTATVWSADIGDPVPGNNSGSVTSEVVAVADLGITKTDTPDPVRAGAPLTYLVTVSNPNGLSTASNVEMVDTLPLNGAFVELVNAGSATCTTPEVGAVGGELVCKWTEIPSNSQRTVSYRIRPLAGEGETVDNRANATTATRNSSGDENPSVSAATITDVIEPELDVLINKSDDVDPVSLGNKVRYTISITNNGPSYGTNAVMTDEFPTPGETPTALFSYQGNLSVSGGGVCDEPDLGATSGVLRCTWPGLGDGETQTVAYDMIAEAITTPGAVTGTGYNRATVRVDETETTYSNNDRNETTDTFRAAIATDLSLSKTANPPGAVVRGTNVAYTITVRNNGPLLSNGAQVIDILPAGLQFLSAPGCVEADRTVTCSVGALPVGGERSFLVTVSVPANYAGPSSVVNRAILDALGDTNPTNNEDEAGVTVPSNVTGIPVNSPLGLLLIASALVGFGLHQQRKRSRY